MRLVDADELLEHAWRDKLDSRELIAKMIQDAPTVKEIPTTIPIDIFERLLPSDREHGGWINIDNGIEYDWGTCSICGGRTMMARRYYPFCPNCGADMRGKKELMSLIEYMELKHKAEVKMEDKLKLEIVETLVDICFALEGLAKYSHTNTRFLRNHAEELAMLSSQSREKIIPKEEEKKGDKCNEA